MDMEVTGRFRMHREGFRFMVDRNVDRAAESPLDSCAGAAAPGEVVHDQLVRFETQRCVHHQAFTIRLTPFLNAGILSVIMWLTGRD